MDNKRKKLSIAMFFLSFASIFLPFFIPPLPELNPDQNFFVDITMAAGLFFGFNFVGLWLHIGSIQESVEQQIASGFKVRQRGFPHTVSDQLNRDILAAHRVRNTYVGIEDIGVSNLYSQWLKNPRNKLWEDIVGIPEFFSDRFASISTGVNQAATHKVYVLREFSHIINFVILEFADPARKDIVYFGWIANDSRGKSQIFSSMDRDVIQMFESQFENLLNITWNAIPEVKDVFHGGFLVDHSYPITKKLQIGPPSLIDKSGCWETLSFSANSEGFEDFSTFSVVRIKFDGDKVDVFSQVFTPEGVRINGFSSNVETTYRLNNLFIVYKSNESDVAGVCHYQFMRNKSRKRTLTGVFCDSYFRQRHTVVGLYREEEIDFSEYTPSFVLSRISELKDKLSEIDSNGDLKLGPTLGHFDPEF